MATPSAPATKAARQARIAAILAMEQVHSQEQLAVLLDSTPACTSRRPPCRRDLDELGVVRLRAADGSLVYALPGEPGGPGSRAGIGLDFPERTQPSLTPPAPPAAEAASELGAARHGTSRAAGRRPRGWPST